MDQPIIIAKKRELYGKNVARKIRKLGWIPAVLYGENKPPVSLSVKPSELSKVLKSSKGKNPVVQLNFEDGNPALAIIKDCQMHPLKRNIIHCDFFRITPESRIKVNVPIVLTGKSEGEMKGGMRYQPLKSVTILCSPFQIPQKIELDVTPLKMGQTLFLSDIEVPEGLKFIYKKDVPVVTIRAVREEVVAPEVKKEEVAAPEAKKEEKEKKS